MHLRDSNTVGTYLEVAEVEVFRRTVKTLTIGEPIVQASVMDDYHGTKVRNLT